MKLSIKLAVATAVVLSATGAAVAALPDNQVQPADVQTTVQADPAPAVDESPAPVEATDPVVTDPQTPADAPTAPETIPTPEPEVEHHYVPAMPTGPVYVGNGMSVIPSNNFTISDN